MATIEHVFVLMLENRSVFPSRTFDHASIIGSLRETFGLGDPLTKRDATAPAWSALL